MTQDNPIHPDPSQPSVPQPSEPVHPARKRRWLRWLVGVVAVLVLLLGLLLIFAPAIASTGPVKSFVLGYVNRDLNGSVAIDSWSLGWSSGISVNNIRVFDDQHNQIAELKQLSTQLKLMDAIHSKLALGQTDISGGRVTFIKYADGTSNFSRLSKTRSAGDAGASSTSRSSSKLPDLSGNIKISDCQAHVTIQGTRNAADAKSQKDQVCDVRSFDGTLSIPSINDPIEQHLTVVAQADGAAPGTIKLDGTERIAKDNVLDMKDLESNVTLALQKIDASMASAFVNAVVAGELDGSCQIVTHGIDNLAPVGHYTLTNFGATQSGVPNPKTLASKLLTFDLVGSNGGKNLSIKTVIQTLIVSRSGVGGNQEIVSEPNTTVQMDAGFVTDDKTGSLSSVTLPVFTVSTADKLVELSVASPEKPLEVAFSSEGSRKYTGKLNCQANLAELHEIMRKMNPPTPGSAAEEESTNTGATAAQPFKGSLNIEMTQNAAKSATEPVIASLDGMVVAGVGQLVDYGLSISDMNVPIHIHQQVLTIENMNRKAGENYPTPGKCNGGTIDLGGLSIDMTGVHTTLNTPANKTLITGVELNAILASKIAAFAGPLFSDPSHATGKLDVMAEYCKALPVDESLHSKGPDNKGVAKFHINIDNLELVNGLVGQGLQAIGMNSVNGSIHDGTVQIASGTVTPNLAVQLGNNASRTLGFAGGIALGDLSLHNFNLSVGNGLLKGIGKQFAGANLVVPMTGSVKSPTLDLAGAVQNNLQNNLLQGGADQLLKQIPGLGK